MGQTINSNTYTIKPGEPLYVICNGYITNLQYECRGQNARCTGSLRYDDGTVAGPGDILTDNDWSSVNYVNPHPTKRVRAIVFTADADNRENELRNFTVPEEIVSEGNYSVTFDISSMGGSDPQNGSDYFVAINGSGISPSGRLELKTATGAVFGSVLSGDVTRVSVLPGEIPQTIYLQFDQPFERLYFFNSVFVTRKPFGEN